MDHPTIAIPGRPGAPLGDQRQQQREGVDPGQNGAAASGSDPFQSVSSFFCSWFGRSPTLVEPSRIDKGLFLGDYCSVKDRNHLQQLKVRSILTVARGLPPLFPGDFDYTVVEIDDLVGANILQHFARCFKAIDEGRAAGGVVVHCAAGISRSATVMIAYIMKTKQFSLEKALAYVRKSRPIVNPNIGFMAQLKRFEEELKRARSGT